ncbi:ABC transporter substrate-binding protein [Anaerosphaera multitolerans]|uniref:ABC transporter substrate-binding protein n=1 Tax=Anaerosphaera multitolerans TaxID=2487351 RepID=A0A437S8V8_9FIRM|nr:ABC transporter substrate-binding protein [Anaerosphaera multitolerans]RVU55533.1 ABC transporter substrate-binding protein [Anaerosphaera multitolerans]
MKKKFVLFAIVFTLSLSLIACGNGEDKSTTQDAEDTLKVAIFTELDSMDPFKMTAGDTETIMDNVFDGLFDSDVEGNLVPDLAESYDISDDGTTYTFKLKEGVKFHNGEDFNAEDVVYTYSELAGLSSGEPKNSKFEIIKDVKALSDYEVEVQLKERKNEFIYLTLKPIVQKDYTENEQFPIGTGPFKFVSRTPGEQLKLERFDDYHRKDHVAKFKNLNIIRIKDRQTVIMAMQSGEVDIVPRISPNEANQLGDVTLISGPQNLVQAFGLNNDFGPLKDPKVREALNYAVDRDEIVSTVGENKATKICSSFSPALPKYYEDLSEYYTYDVEKAKALLAEAGYENGFDLNVTVPSDYQYHMDTAELLESQLSKVNVRVTIEPIEFSTWLSKVYNDRDFEATIVGFIGYLDPNQILVRYVSDYSSNYINFNNPKYDEAIEKASTAISEEEQIAHYKEAQKILVEDNASVFIQDPDSITALRPGIEGLEMYPIQKMNLEDVYLEK